MYSTVSLILLTILPFRSGFVYINVSPHNSYSLTEAEKIPISNAILQFRERVEQEKFNEIAEDVSKGRQSAYWGKIILKDIQLNDRKVIVEKYPNELIIPYADRYIEIRY